MNKPNYGPGGLRRKLKNFKKDTEFQRLSNEWNLKLKQSGFKDIESDEEREFGFVRCDDYDVVTPNINYFNSCINYLNSDSISDATDKLILSMHCDGVPLREISKRLTEFDIKLSKSAIHRHLSRLLEDAGIEPIGFK